MKHPALARAFAIVLMILCLLMLGNGISGFGKASAETAERIAFSEKYAERIETYIRVDEELAHSISYEEAYEELEKLQEQHDSGASQHRTDVALYSAEKGGYTMGADMIWEAMPEVKGARQQMEFAKAQLAEKEKIYAENKGTIDSTIAAANNGAASCRNAAASLNPVMADLNALIASEPEKPPETPVLPPEGPAPEDPGEWTETEPEAPADPGEEPTEPGEDASEEDMLAYQEAKALYDSRIGPWNEYLSALADYQGRHDSYLQHKAAWDDYNAQTAAYQQYLQTSAAYMQWAGQCMQTMTGHAGTIGAAGAVLQQQGASLAELGQSAASIAAAFGSDMGGNAGGMMPGFDPSALGGLQNATDIREVANAVGALQAGLGAMADGFGAVSGGLGQIGSGIEEARQKVSEAEKQLRVAESQLQGQLENIWYELGELEKDKEDLEKEKTELDEEAALLSKKLVETEELKRLKNRRISTRQLLISQGEVKARTEETGDLVRSAREFLEDYRQETERLSRGRRLINLLAVIGAAAGVIGIPAAYEKIKSRFWLLAPVVVCLCCAVAADGVNMALGLGQMYTALFTAIFAAIQLLILLPKKKIPTESV